MTGAEHVSLNTALMLAATKAALARGYRTCIACSSSHTHALHAHLPANLPIEWIPIRVIGGYRRTFIRKFFIEFISTCRLLRRAQHNQGVILITSLLPNTLALTLLLRSLLGKGNVHILLHVEVEAMFMDSKQRIDKLGFWSSLALKRLYDGKWPRLYVLGEGIRSRLVTRLPQYPALREIRAFEHPYLFRGEGRDLRSTGGPVRVGFVGAGRVIKGIHAFCRMAASFGEDVRAGRIEFVVVGGLDAVSPALDTSHVIVLSDKPGSLAVQDYADAIASLDSALFLYERNYQFTASGAVFDVINEGVEVLTLPNQYLSDLAGSETESGILFFDSSESITALLRARLASGSRPRRHAYESIRARHGEQAGTVLSGLLFGPTP